MFLRDEDLHDRINQQNIIAGLPKDRVPFTAASPVQASSVDLRIGRIHIPGATGNDVGAATRSRTRLELKPGQTAVVMIAERCNFPSDVGAIGFPPASVSSKGILMTNPGHVDPGYHGKLSFTVINMGSEGYELRTGEVIVTLLLFALGAPAKADYTARKGAGASAIRQELLDGLSHDFLDVDRRVSEALSRSERTARWLAVGVPLFAAVVLFAGTFISTRSETKRLDEQVKALQAQIEAARQREVLLRETIGRLDARTR